MFATIEPYTQSHQPTQPTSQAKILRQHFFRRFFDNDTLSLEAETQSAVVRALCAFAVPSLMVAFWLLPHYPNRNEWATAADRYFFVLYSFVAMGAVTTFQWEMLFPDRSDFLILLPLPLQSRELFAAKAKALLMFLGLFLAAANLFPLILYSAESTTRFVPYFPSVWAHFAPVVLAGSFAAFAVLAIEGIALCLLPSRWFRTVSLALQSLFITALLLLLLLFPLFASHMQTLLEGRATFASWIPPLWFLGLYEHLRQGSAAPDASQSLAALGITATILAASIALITYPLAWARQKKRALEGASTARKPSPIALSAFLHNTLLRRPQSRGIFHFLSQTIARNSRYQTYLAIYAGVGLALTLAAILTLTPSPSNTLTPSLSNLGLHAALPLLLFWLVLGLKAAFAFPIDMRARWIFPISLRHPGLLYPGPDAKAAKLWLQLCAAALSAAILATFLALHWSYLNLLIQLTCAAALTLLLADLFFLGRTQIPFTRPRMPGRSSLPLILTLYAALFPALILATVKLELATESHPIQFLWIIAGTALLHLLLTQADRLAQQGIIGGFPEDETDEGPQLLNLSQ